MTKPLTIIDSHGIERTQHSGYCPNCISEKIEDHGLGEMDFDEKGWHQTRQFKCLNPKCNHTWSEKVIIIPGSEGVLYKHAIR